MRNGLYRVTTSYLCAGFVYQNGIVVACADILQSKFSYWKTKAIWVCP